MIPLLILAGSALLLYLNKTQTTDQAPPAITPSVPAEPIYAIQPTVPLTPTLLPTAVPTAAAPIPIGAYTAEPTYAIQPTALITPVDISTPVTSVPIGGYSAYSQPVMPSLIAASSEVPVAAIDRTISYSGFQGLGRVRVRAIRQVQGGWRA